LRRLRDKAFGNWRAKFKAEPQPLARKVLYRRGGLSHALSHGSKSWASHDLPGASPIVPPAHEGRRRRFSEADKWQILLEAMRPDARFSEVVPVGNLIRLASEAESRNVSILREKLAA
jgi:hypothetical protein